MISLTVLFWIFVVLFIFIGAIRGWAKEVLVTFSGILAIFVISILLPLIANNLETTQLFWARVAIITGCAFFGYQTPNFRRISESGKMIRNAGRDVILGAIFGGFNGYMLMGSIWYFMAQAGYPFPEISAPDLSTELGQQAVKILAMSLPAILTVPRIYYAIAIALAFLIVVLI